MKNLKAYISFVIMEVIYGLSIFFTSSLLESGNTLDILALRFLICSIACILLRAAGVIKINVKGKPIKLLIIMTIFQPVLYFIFETLALSRATTMITGMMLAMMPVIIIIMERIFLKEKNTIIQNVLILLSVFGALFISYMSTQKEGKNTLLGILFIFLGMLCSGLFTISVRKASDTFTGIEITYYMAIAGAIAYNFINFIVRLSKNDLVGYFDLLFNFKNIIGFIYLSMVSSIVATFLGNYSLSRVQASTLTAFSGVSTITSILASIFLRGEVLMYYHIIGAVLILTGSIGNAYIKNKKDRL